MTAEQTLDLAQLAMTTLLIVSGPIMAVALVVGLLIALFQALTSLQEMTLTFVPKIFCVLLALLLFLPWMSDRLYSMADEIFAQIGNGGVVGPNAGGSPGDIGADIGTGG